MRQLSNFDQVSLENLYQNQLEQVELDKMDIDYKVSGFVPGRMLDQFSMDEYKGNLRVATTTGNAWWGMGRSESLNHMYVLDGDLDIIGSVEDLAEGERIYSSRFMGKRASLR